MKKIIYNLKREVLLATVVMIMGIVALCVFEVMTAKTTSIEYNIELWIDGCNILDFFFPLFSTLPFTWILYYERKDRFLCYVSVRTNRKKYLFQKMISGMIVVFLMVFIIYYTGLIVAELFIKPTTIVSDGLLYRYVFGELQAEKPLLFGCVWCIWKGIIGALLCGFGYCISLLADNVFVITLFPFLYCTIENFVTGTLGLERYSICTTYILNRLSPRVMNMFYYCAGLLSFAIIGGVIIIIWNYRKKKVENSEEYN